MSPEPSRGSSPTPAPACSTASGYGGPAAVPTPGHSWRKPQTFRRLDAAPLLARTRAEQELSGQHVRRDPAPDRDAATVLTAQEARVVRLATEGLTNREIGTQLLICPRTVGYHLASVFPKLGIVSRADLARVDFGDGLRLMD
ncbi:helix-turn-helix domain-containing protein [Streptomyces europaeiscabiei]|uniref:helix-turn-helix domain-containing protein n=1 Tax=Streptomyces europaeiscabiei TaxID=146819 RepID=UPI0038F6C15B